MSMNAQGFGGGGSVADATETTAGKIRIATSAEAATGTSDVIAMTPLTVKEVVDSSLVGGVEYKGTFNATTGLTSSGGTLAAAEKGDMYVIDTIGTIYGQTWAVGDHLLINEDMGGSITNSKIDKVDNTDQVTSVNGLTGPVVLSGDDLAADHSASHYTPADANIDGHFSGVDTALGNKQPLDAGLTSISGLTTAADKMIYTTGSDTYAVADLTAAGRALLDDADASAQRATLSLGTAALLDEGTSANNLVQLDGSAKLPAVDGSQLTNLPSGNQIVDVEIKTGSSFTAASNYIYLCSYTGGTQSITFPAASSSSDGDLIALFSNSTVRAVNIVSSDGTSNDIIDINNAQKGGTSGALSLDIDRQLVWFAPSGTAWRQLNASIKTVATSGAYSDLSGTPTLGTAAAANTGDFLASTAGLNNLSDVTINSVSNGQVISYNSTSGEWENSTPASGGATDLNGLSDVTITSAASGNLLQHNGSGQFVNVAKSTIDVGSFNDDSTYQPLDAGLTSISGLTTAANKMLYATGSDTYAVTDLTAAGRALLDDADAAAQRATLSLGTAALLDEGEDANNLVQLDGSARLPAVDGSQLTNLPSSGATDLDGLSDVTITSAASGNLLQHNGSGQFVNVAKNTIDVGSFNDDGTYLNDVVDDTTPQLGGPLDTNGQSITSASNADVTIDPNGTGSIVIGADLATSSNANLALAPNGTGYVEVKGNTNPGAIRLNCESNSHGIQIQSPPHSATAEYNLILPTGVGTDGQVLKTDGGDGGDPETVQLAWVDQASGGGGGGFTYSAVSSATTAQAQYHYSVTGTTTITLPAASGVTAGQEVRIKNMGTNTVTVSRSSSDTIDSEPSIAMAVQYQALSFVSNGSNGWEII